MIETYNSFLTIFIDIVEVILNSIAIFIVLKAVITGTVVQKRGHGSAKHVICKGISEALNYNLANEVLKIIILQDLKDLYRIGGILILKAMITGLFILELKQEKLQDDMHKEKTSNVHKQHNNTQQK